MLLRSRRLGARGGFTDGAREVAVVPDRGIVLTAADVAHLAVAKAATAVGQRVLLRRLGLAPGDLRHVYLAGGFANALDVQASIDIGLLLPVDPARVVRAGNASVAGAKALLLSRRRRAELESVVRRIDHVELESEPDFFDCSQTLPVRADHRLSELRCRCADALATSRFATIVDSCPGRATRRRARPAALKMAEDLAANRGYRPCRSRTTPAPRRLARWSRRAGDRAGHDVIVHVACRDRNRNGLQSRGWDLLSRGLTTVLAVSGDYPVEGYDGLSKPVFDVDSVGLLELYRELGEAAVARAAADGVPDPSSHGFFLGCAVSNVKRFERERVPQYLKLALKVRSGAGFVMSQVGYDVRKQDELLRVMRRDGLAIPAIANAYILGPGVARSFHAGRVPGCVVSDELLALVERRATGPDKGRAFFLEFAAKQLVVARGLGSRGIYLSGHRDATGSAGAGVAEASRERMAHWWPT